MGLKTDDGLEWYGGESSVHGPANSLPNTDETHLIVYGLVDPRTNDLRYIGRTGDPAIREYQHTKSQTATITENTPVGEWIRRLRRMGHEPRFVEMESYETKQEMLIGEEFWIWYHRDEMGTDLLNVEDGGESIITACFVTPFEGYVIFDGKRWRTETVIRKEKTIDKANLDTIPTVIGIDCIPDAEPIFMRDGKRWLNVYVPPRVKPTVGEHPRIDRIINWLCDSDEKAINYVTHWIAKKVQEPERKNMTALVFQGQQGTGKDTLAMIVMEMIGRENCARINQSQLETRFNAGFAEKLLVVADEVINRENLFDTASTLKTYLTDETVAVEQKFVPVREVPNRMSWVFTSNASVPVQIEGEHDRRYTVIRNMKPPSEEHRALLRGVYGKRDSLDEEFVKSEVAAFMRRLFDLRVDRELIARPLDNEARKLIAKAGQSSVDAFVDVMEEQGLLGVCAMFWGESLLDMMEKNGTWDRHRLKQGECTTTLLYSVYGRFCQMRGFGQMNDSRFGIEIRRRLTKLETKRGVGKLRTERPRIWVGLPTLHAVAPETTSEPKVHGQKVPTGPFAIQFEERAKDPMLMATTGSLTVEEAFQKLLDEPAPKTSGSI